MSADMEIPLAARLTASVRRAAISPLTGMFRRCPAAGASAYMLIEAVSCSLPLFAMTTGAGGSAARNELRILVVVANLGR